MKKTILSIFISIVTSFCWAQQDSRNGMFLPTADTIRILIVFADCIPDSNWVYNWDIGKLPKDADKIVDTAIVSQDSLKGYLTKYFHQMSFGKYIVIGDYYPELITVLEKDFKNDGDANVLDSLQHKTRISKHGYAISNSVFDEWEFKNGYKPKSKISDGALDILLIIWRRNPYFKNLVGGTFTNKLNETSLFDYNGINCIARMNTLNYGVLKHEYSHGLLGGNNFHCANAGAGRGTFLSNQGGISMLHGECSFGAIAHPQERRRLGWKNPNSLFVINAKDLNGDDLNSDLTVDDFRDSAKTIILRDYVSTGDAIRIELPYLKSSHKGTKSQWLWLTNHQLKEGYFDINPPSKKGIYAYIQVGVEAFDEFRAKTNYFVPLSAFGNYDIILRDTTNIFSEADFSTALQNSFTGANLTMQLASNRREPHDIVDHEEFVVMKKTYFNGNELGEEHFHYKQFGNYGSDLNAFLPGSTIDINSNPSPTPMLTYTTPYRVFSDIKLYEKPQPYDNRVVYLNNIKIEILSQFDNGDIALRISNNGKIISGQNRWCGQLVLKDTISLEPKSSIYLEQGLTTQKPNNPKVFKSKHVFADSTWLRMDSLSFVELNSAKIIINDKSSMIVSNFSHLKLAGTSELIINEGSSLTLRENCTIGLSPKSKITVMGNLNISKNLYEVLHKKIKIKSKGMLSIYEE